jgi:amino-acid N-acetyltransferase
MTRKTDVDSAPKIEIRDAHKDDLNALQTFLKPFVEAKHILPRSDEDLLTLVRHGFVAERDGNVVGFAALEIYSKKLAEIQSLAVAKSLQGQGVGTQLVEACVARARQENVLELMAITAKENLFRKVGFDFFMPNQKRAVFLQTREDRDD